MQEIEELVHPPQSSPHTDWSVRLNWRMELVHARHPFERIGIR